MKRHFEFQQVLFFLIIITGCQNMEHKRESLNTPDVYVSHVWVADNGDGTYQNPILHSDYSDPDAIHVGDDYYMTASSFNYVPGLPILHSKDLVTWTIVAQTYETGYADFDWFRIEK